MITAAKATKIARNSRTQDANTMIAQRILSDLNEVIKFNAKEGKYVARTCIGVHIPKEARLLVIDEIEKNGFRIHMTDDGIDSNHANDLVTIEWGEAINYNL